MDEKKGREFLPYQLSSPGLPDYPEGRWSRDWKNAAASTGLAPARWGFWREGGREGKRERIKNEADEKRLKE